MALIDAIQHDDRTFVVEASRDLRELGVELYRAHSDKGWSLTDCTSFVVMQQSGLVEALTADKHFSQAGFTPLLT